MLRCCWHLVLIKASVYIGIIYRIDCTMQMILNNSIFKSFLIVMQMIDGFGGEILERN